MTLNGKKLLLLMFLEHNYCTGSIRVKWKLELLFNHTFEVIILFYMLMKIDKQTQLNESLRLKLCDSETEITENNETLVCTCKYFCTRLMGVY